MKKLLLLYLIILLPALTCMFFSCKKVYHSTNPTPEDYRLLSYTKVTTQNIVFPFLAITPVVTEDYRFVYDQSQRVTQIFYTSNDATAVTTGLADLSIKFTYLSDTIYKTSTDLNTSTVKERDTFIQNTLGQITNAYFPNEVHMFTYYGKLLANETVTYRDSGTAISATLSYTSNNGDFLYRLFNNVLTATFPDTGIRPDITPIDTFWDTVLALPLTITWTLTNNSGASAITTHNMVNSYSDEINGYNQNSVVLNAIDPNGVRVRPGYFPAGYCTQQFYQIYDYLTNRPGDYLQIGSFTTYGVNIYQEVHLVRAITTPYFNTNVSYTIDADSKITYTSAIIRDSLLKNTTNLAYKFQYETF